MTNRAPSASFVTNAWTYHVFLSFRGVDTRHGFTNNLHQALLRNGIYSFIDHEDLQVGEEISPALTKAIEGSRIGIIVFSENYASSTFCLEELAEILKYIKENGRFVFPIFYKVDACNVQRQLKSYKEAFDKHEKRFGHNSDKIKKWKAAMYQASNIKGEHFIGNEYEYDFIARIIQQVSRIINRQLLHIPANYLVSLESRVQNVIQLLHGESTEIKCMMGICGIGGIGKSTIARAIFNLLADQFEGLCFLADVRENSIDNRGLVQLQHTLLFEILGREDMKFSEVHKGSEIIKDRLQQKKVLLVLDDIDKLKQLQMLAGGLDWFGHGSIIIITTRNKHLLRVHGVERIYEVEGLNDAEAYELFCWNAFKKNEADSSYMNTSKRAVRYCGGLPLALDVIGCNLFGKSIEECESALDSYERNPNKEIQEILRVSYDGLEEIEKVIFLDIACFFKGYMLRDVKDILLNSRGFNPEYAISVLVEKSLISIGQKSRHNMGHIVSMHDLIQDMGRETVRQESKLNPSELSRLWSHEDILDVLQENKGSRKTEFIILDLPENEVVEWDGEAFKDMKNLKVLVIKNACFSQAPKHLPNSLRILDWPGYPSTSLPQDFHPTKLVRLNLTNCLLELDKPLQKFKALTYVNLCNNRFLTQIPDVYGVPNLRRLNLKGCINLIAVHDSTGHHDRLRRLYLTGCFQLKIFPHSIKSKYLTHVDFSGCSTLPSFPKFAANDLVVSVDTFSHSSLSLGGPLDFASLNTSISMFSKLDKLICGSGEESSKVTNLVVKYCSRIYEVLTTNFSWFRTLEVLNLSNNKLTEDFLCTRLLWFPNLTELDLTANDFKILPACINQCSSLRRLVLDQCYELGEIGEIPSSVKHLSALDCRSLSYQSLRLLSREKLHEGGGTYFILPESSRDHLEQSEHVMILHDIPKWFNHCSRWSLSFWFREKFPSIALCHFCLGVPSKGFTIQVHVNGREIGSHSREVVRHWHLFDLKVCFQSSWSDELLEEYIKDGWNHVEFKYEGDEYIKDGWNYVEFESEGVAYIKNGWNHVEFKYDYVPFSERMGVYVYKHNPDAMNIQFADPTIGCE